MRGYISLVGMPGCPDKKHRNGSSKMIIGAFRSEKAARLNAAYGGAVAYDAIEKHCRLPEKEGVFFTRQDQSFGELFSALAEAYPELI